MRRLVSLFVILFAARHACAATTPAAVAKLVLAPDAAALAEHLTAVLSDPQPLVRATAARIAAVRDLKPLAASLREAIARETDSSAAREEICALALIGSDDDVAFAAAASAKLPSSVDEAMAVAIGRRGGLNALSVYETKLRPRALGNLDQFFRAALWRHDDLVSAVASRLVESGDTRAWTALLSVLRESEEKLPPALLSTSLAGPEALRYQTLAWLVHSYASDPKAIPESLRATATESRGDAGSNREEFARTLLSRMLGAERKDDARLLAWVQTTESDELLGDNDSGIVLQYLTDAEYAARYGRCRKQSANCPLPEKRVRDPFPSERMPSQAVARPAFNLPDVLPAGLVHGIMSESRCRNQWLGVLNVTVDGAGRVQSAPLDIDLRGGCRDALGEILHLSFASTNSVSSPLTAPILVVKAHDDEPCLDWQAPEKVNAARVVRMSSDVTPPVVTKRVQARFPEAARYEMIGGQESVMLLEAVVSAGGCIRSLRFLTQSPLPTLNGAAAVALSQWKFVPGTVGGQPVDVIFDIAFSFHLK
jgi:hypothetical protein